MSKAKPTELILHGHFYQPPRENPLTGLIPKQSSAKPYANWNEKIHADCYAANAYSRYLDADGKILSITNNYAYISFNFGPTLLSWLESNHPFTYQRIIQADEESRKRLGHGNALAQSFNHTILPLDSPKAADLQIHWGIEDFQRRFNRKPEGMWLPETAVNSTVIDILAAADIKFILLSPWQVEAIETAEGVWAQLNGKAAPSDSPYILQGEKHSIAAFFYHPDLATDISFGHILRNADAMYEKLLLMKKRDKAPLIHAATDGEIYGHHEPFGDMGLSALIEKVSTRTDFAFTNYATYLEHHKPTLHARLKQGEDNRGTSWSCAHGVSRWYKDCGCHTGGEESWNQAWRTPLRNACDNLSAKLDTLFEERIADIYQGSLAPQKLLLHYGTVLSGSMNIEKFIQNQISFYSFDASYRHELAALLEGMKNRHFMYTSCGWFFNDISGLEPQHNIAYALTAISLFAPYANEDILSAFLDDLSHAESNKKSIGTGKDIALSSMTTLSGQTEAALFFYLNRRAAHRSAYQSTYGTYRLIDIGKETDCPLLIKFSNTTLLKRFQCIVDAHESSFDELAITMELTDEKGTKEQVKLTTADIPANITDAAFFWIDHSMSLIQEEDFRDIANDIQNYAMLSKFTPYQQREPLFIKSMGTCLHALSSIFIHPGTLSLPRKQEQISLLIEFIMKRGSIAEKEQVKQIFSYQAGRTALYFQLYGMPYEVITYTIDMLELAHSKGVYPDLTKLQDAFYPYLISIEKENPGEYEPEIINKLAVLLNFSMPRK